MTADSAQDRSRRESFREAILNRRMLICVFTGFSSGLPLYVLVDNDPWGLYIYSVVKQGSINLAYESMRMAVPQARFVGLSSFDAERYGLSQNVAIMLDEVDQKRAKQMLSYAWFQRKEWQKELRKMLQLGIKLELEALYRLLDEAWSSSANVGPASEREFHALRKTTPMTNSTIRMPYSR